jgi:hypothetical protein
MPKASRMKIILLGFFLFVTGIPGLWAQENGRHWPPADSFIVLSKAASILNLDKVMLQIRQPHEVYEITGKVIVRILLDENGKYIQHIVLRDPYPPLTKSFTDVVPLMKATPAEIDGRPVASWVTIPYQPCYFRLGIARNESDRPLRP